MEQQLRIPTLVVLMTLANAIAAAQAGAPDVATIVARMEQARAADRASYRAYRVIRDYRFFNGGEDKISAQVLAEVDFQPPKTKSYVIREATGSDRGEKLVRKMLEHERKASQDQSDVEPFSQNYDFAFLRQETRKGAMCYVLQLIPKRKDKNLLKGAMWVDANTYLIHHIEGELVKSPSFWLKEVRLSMDFNRVAGMWLRTATEAVASVRFFGKHSMRAHDLRYETGTVVAAATRRPKPARTAGARRAILSAPAVTGLNP